MTSCHKETKQTNNTIFILYNNDNISCQNNCRCHIPNRYNAQSICTSAQI